MATLYNTLRTIFGECHKQMLISETPRQSVWDTVYCFGVPVGRTVSPRAWRNLSSSEFQVVQVLCCTVQVTSRHVVDMITEACTGKSHKRKCDVFILSWQKGQLGLLKWVPTIIWQRSRNDDLAAGDALSMWLLCCRYVVSTYLNHPSFVCT